jgi:hypothetical protein
LLILETDDEEKISITRANSAVIITEFLIKWRKEYILFSLFLLYDWFYLLLVITEIIIISFTNTRLYILALKGNKKPWKNPGENYLFYYDVFCL